MVSQNLFVPELDELIIGLTFLMKLTVNLNDLNMHLKGKTND